MIKFIILIIIFIFLLYCIIPVVLTSILGIGVIRNGRRIGKNIGLTFNGLPHPKVSNQLLSLLKKKEAKCTFFISGEIAQKHPQLVHKIKKQGHLIGFKNYSNKPNWFLSPFESWAQPDSASRAIRMILKEEPEFYRPPFGLINILNMVLPTPYQIVLYSLKVSNWKEIVQERKGFFQIKKNRKQNLLNRIKDGDIILYKDNDILKAKANASASQSIDALSVFITELQSKGYRFIRVDEMGLEK